MGVYLSRPATDKALEEGGNEWCKYGVAQMQGWRMTMEDAHAVHLDMDPPPASASGQSDPAPTSLFAVFDGHGGSEVAKYAARHMAEQIAQTAGYLMGDPGASLAEVFVKVDDMMMRPEAAAELLALRDGSLGVGDEPSAAQKGKGRVGAWPGPQAGSTAVVALCDGSHIALANAGDARAVLCERGEAQPLTRDHTPALYSEAQRVIKAGGFIANNRVNGRLAVTRALGDMDFKDLGKDPAKQVVMAVPEVHSRELTSGSEFLILACDGIWEVLSDQEAVSIVRIGLESGKSLPTVAALLCDTCMAPSRHALKGAGLDNMTVIIVQFTPGAVPVVDSS